MLENVLFGLLGALIVWFVMRGRLVKMKARQTWFMGQLLEARNREAEVRRGWDKDQAFDDELNVN